MCECRCYSIISTIAYVLLLIGGINWGLIGAFDFNLVTHLFGVGTLVTRGIYLLVGLAAIVSLLMTIIYYIKKTRI